jgi:hypothetical protein
MLDLRLCRNRNRQIPLSAHATVAHFGKEKGHPQETGKARIPGRSNAAFKRAYEQLFGSQGGASPVRKIDPVTGEVIATSKTDQ